MTELDTAAPTSLDEDGDLAWDFPEGAEVLPGVLAAEPLGVGHRLETWLVWRRQGWHPAILKLPRPHQLTHARALASLRRELAGLAAGAGHPAFPRLVFDGSGHDLPHLLMEYLDGPSLAETVDEDGPLGVIDTALLGTSLLPALVVLHERGLAHVDVKPENVLLPDGRPKLVDFASAREIGSTQPQGMPVGTPGYVAPEMERCDPISASMDVFGLGTVLAEALTGRPFPDHPELPDGPLAAVVERLLDPDPARRGSIADTQRDLVAVIPDDRRPWPAWADAHLPT
jgi:eukaryotic-like serine/threonine-protein kinase